MNLASERRGRDRFGPVVAGLVAAVALAACGSGSASAGPNSAGANGTGVVQHPASVGPPPSPTLPDDTTPVTLDPTLLAFLPEAIDGIPVLEDADEAAAALTDPALSKIATSIDTAVAVDTGTGNLVYALVVRLRPGAFGAEVYRQWRDSFDEGACAAAGGVTGRAEATLGGRQAFITSCGPGLRTYHVLLEAQNVVISASATGEGRFGEKLMETLRVPG